MSQINFDATCSYSENSDAKSKYCRLEQKGSGKINICLPIMEMSANDKSAQELQNALKNEVHTCTKILTELWPFYNSNMVQKATPKSMLLSVGGRCDRWFSVMLAGSQSCDRK